MLNDLPPKEMESKAEEIYMTYFGSSWREKLHKYLLIEVAVATPEDRIREGNKIGWVGTSTVIDKHTSAIKQNRIIIYSNPNDFSLRTEIGESLYNLLQCTALSNKVYKYKEGDDQFFLEGVANLINQGFGKDDIPQKCCEILNYWDKNYTNKPKRYHGMNPDRPREYKGIPEWKSEGFADAVAVEIRRKSGLPLSAFERDIWQQLDPLGPKLIEPCVEIFLPPITHHEQ